MIDKNGVRLALRKILVGLDAVAKGAISLPNLQTNFAWENVDFVPPEVNPRDVVSCLWIKEGIAWGQERQITLGYLEQISIASYDVYTPAGAGTEDAENLAKALGDTFQPGTGAIVDGSLTPSGEQIQLSIVRSEAGSGHKLQDGPWYVVPVRITFRAYGQTGALR